jgi:hypothetical protein
MDDEKLKHSSARDEPILWVQAFTVGLSCKPLRLRLVGVL